MVGNQFPEPHWRVIVWKSLRQIDGAQFFGTLADHRKNRGADMWKLGANIEHANKVALYVCGGNDSGNTRQCRYILRTVQQMTGNEALPTKHAALSGLLFNIRHHVNRADF